MKNKKLWIFVGIIFVIVVLNYLFGWSDYISNAENLEFLKKIVQDNLALAAAIYVVLTIIGCVVLALPGITFALFAGVVFGPLLGTVFCSLATTVGAMLAFLVGRFFLKESIKPMVMKHPYLRKWLFDESERNEIFILLVTRLVPLFPYNLQNFAYGITDIRFRTFSVCSFLFMLPGTAMYTVGTAGLAEKENRVLYISIAAGLAAAVFGLGLFFKKKYIRREETDGK